MTTTFEADAKLCEDCLEEPRYKRHSYCYPCLKRRAWWPAKEPNRLHLDLLSRTGLDYAGRSLHSRANVTS